jgi:hypothetical protein
MNSWKTKLHDYEFILWDSSRFDINSSIWVKEAFEAKKYAFAADFIRFYAVYNFGGIYLDTDIEIIKPFDDLLNNKIMMAFEDSAKNIASGCFGAEQGSFFIKRCLDYYENRPFVKADGSYDTLPVPQIMKNVLQEYFFDMNLYTADYFTAKARGVISITNNTYCVHHFAGSWLSERNQRYKYIRDKILKYLGNNTVSRCIILILISIKRIQDVGLINTVKYYYNRLSPP